MNHPLTLPLRIGVLLTLTRMIPVAQVSGRRRRRRKTETWVKRNALGRWSMDEMGMEKEKDRNEGTYEIGKKGFKYGY